LKKHWPKREKFIPGMKYVANNPLINHEKMYLPLLHIKLGLKNIMMAMNQNIMMAINQNIMMAMNQNSAGII